MYGPRRNRLVMAGRRVGFSVFIGAPAPAANFVGGGNAAGVGFPRGDLVEGVVRYRDTGFVPDAEAPHGAVPDDTAGMEMSGGQLNEPLVRG
jgi:hypothetical protein